MFPQNGAGSRSGSDGGASGSDGGHDGDAEPFSGLLEDIDTHHIPLHPRFCEEVLNQHDTGLGQVSLANRRSSKMICNG